MEIIHSLRSNLATLSTLFNLRSIDLISSLIPNYLLSKMPLTEWEDAITERYESFAGFQPIVARQGFLSHIRLLDCYGCSLFPTCAEVPPSGFFEYRTQNWMLAPGPNALMLIDYETHQYVWKFKWENIRWTSSSDQIYIVEYSTGKQKQIELITPQAKIIDNLCKRLKYKWAREQGMWRDAEH